MINSLENYYKLKCSTKSDINEHLPTLYKYSKECTSIVECGVRDIVSSYAFAFGLKGKINKYTLIDPYESSQIPPFLSLCASEGVNASFMKISDIKCAPIETELLFIDTWHNYGQLKRELAHWNLSVKKYIIMHDTTVDEWHGESIRNKSNVQRESIESGFPDFEITKGLWYAIVEFLIQHPEWKIKERFTNNNGLTVLERINDIPQIGKMGSNVRYGRRN